MFLVGPAQRAAGHTYGANGIWQVNTETQPYGPSPHGNTWGNRPWNQAKDLPGSSDSAIAKALLTRYPWWQFKSHPEWVEPAANPNDNFAPYAAGIPQQVRFCIATASSGAAA